MREQRAAAAIQATWRMLGDRCTAERLRKEKLFREMGQCLATRIQAGWWGYRWVGDDQPVTRRLTDRFR